MSEQYRQEDRSDEARQTWEHYEPPADFETLAPAEKLAELCKLKLATYAPEVQQLPDSTLRLFLWKLSPGRTGSRYERELTIWSESEGSEFRIEMTTPPGESGGDHGVRKEVAVPTSAAEEVTVVAIAEAMETATALPGMPMSRYYVPDWIARGEACARGRIPERMVEG